MRPWLKVLVVAVAVAGCSSGSPPRSAPTPSCCVRPPTPGQLGLQSYSFPVRGASGSLNVQMGIAEPKGITLQSAYLDSDKLPSTFWCGLQSTSNWEGSACTVSATFGPSHPAPPTGSRHTLKIVENTGATYTFTVTAGTTESG